MAFIFLALYFTFLGGSAYYNLIFPVRILHHVLVTLILALWLFSRIRRRGGLPNTPLNLPIAALSVVWVVTAVFSIDPRMAFENLWLQLTHVLLFYILVDLFQRGRQRLVMETQFMLAAVVIFISGLETASWYFGLGITPGTSVGWVNVLGPGAWLPLQPLRLSLAMNISTLLAGYVAPLVTLTAAWALTASRRDYRRVLWAMCALLAIILFFTFSRGGMLSVLTAVGFIVVMRLSQQPQVIQRVPARVLLGGAFALAVVGVAGFIILSISSSSSRAFGDEGRLDMWRSAVSMTRDRPLTGVGAGLFGRAFRDYRNPDAVQDKLAAAHNIYLNTLAETGLPVILVCIWLAVAFVGTWYRNWKNETASARRFRLEAAFGALLGLGVHSLVDAFTITPVVVLFLLLVAYCIAPVYDRLALPPAPRRFERLASFAALVAVLAYGLWFVQLDRAQSQYNRSLTPGDSALSQAQAAAELDPGLELYALQVDYLKGDRAAYQDAVLREPTWDTGWLNLGALALRDGDNQTALAAFDRARQINRMNPAAQVAWARVAETMSAAPPGDIADAYYQAMLHADSLPLSAFWRATDLRRQALNRYLDDLTVDLQYRVLVMQDSARAGGLVPQNPSTAAEWWVVGERALTVQKDPAAAVRAFSEAIQRARTTGDYYASRARAEMETDKPAALRDLNFAQLLGTYAEYPSALRAQFPASPEVVRQLRANALPTRFAGQEFAAVLYGGRPSAFQLLPEVRPVGPGRQAMQPWYDIAADYEQAGQPDRAINVYRAILEYAPDEQEAREQLRKLGDAAFDF
jgi:O-antigen ligase/cytochrome c-type biogenesis protein CcmH/NrfG